MPALDRLTRIALVVTARATQGCNVPGSCMASLQRPLDAAIRYKGLTAPVGLLLVLADCRSLVHCDPETQDPSSVD